MEILIAVAAKAVEFSVYPIKRVAIFIFNPQSTIQETYNEYNQLQGLCNQVNNQCQEPRLNGEEILEDVRQWQNEAQDTLNEVDQWRKKSVTNQTNASTTCSRLCLSDWVWAHKQRKIAKQKKEKLADIFKRGNKLSRISRLPSARGVQLLSGDGFIVFKSVQLAFNDIMRALRRPGQSMIGVYGMGGVGKTSLVKTAITAVEEQQLFSKVVVSVVSQTTNINKIQADLGEQLSLRYSGETELVRATQLWNRMKYEKTILVVLDDVWNIIDFKKIGIPYGEHEGCKVLLTTRLERVCSSMLCHATIKLSLLNDEESWYLFKSHSGTKLDNPPSQLKELATKVIQECNGLPLALVVVASALRDKDQEEWEWALQKLQSSKPDNLEDVQIVYERIKLSYDFLTVEVTKRFFLMCSLFPEDYEISVEVLTRYALGYGLFDQYTTINSYKAATIEVKIIIRKLLDCSLLLKPDSISERVKMHDMVRDAALWITSTGEEVFLVPIDSQKHWTTDPKLVHATAISLLACPMNQHLPPTSIDCSRLNMLLLAQRAQIPPQIVHDRCFDGMKALRVLDMTAIAANLLELVLPSSLELLENLRTLYLRRWILKGNLSIIGSLTSLEFLSFAGSEIEDLPEELIELTALKSLDLSACTARTGFNEVVISKLVLKVKNFCPPNQPLLDLYHDED